MENSPWHVYKIKKPWEVSPYPQLLLILKKLNMCRQVHFETCHHQNTDILLIFVAKTYSSSLTTAISVL